MSEQQEPERRTSTASREKQIAFFFSVASLVLAFAAWIGPGMDYIIRYPSISDGRFSVVERRLNELELQSQRMAERVEQQSNKFAERSDECRKNVAVLDSRLDELCRRMGVIESER